MQGRKLLWIAVVQVLAGLGATPGADTKDAQGPVLTVCRMLEEPAATGLRLGAEQSGLTKRFPDAHWPVLLGVLTVPVNIVFWTALLRTLLGEESARPTAAARRARRGNELIVPTGSVLPADWSFRTRRGEH